VADFDFLLFALTAVQEANHVDEVIGFWARHRYYLSDWRLIYSHPSISSFSAPSKTWPRNFPRGGFLRPLFSHDNLYFLDDVIIDKLANGREANINIDVTLVFDTNVARYVEAFIDGRNTANKDAAKEVFDFLIQQKVSFDYSFYTLENARSYYSGRNVASIKRNLVYLLKLDLLDDETYLNTGKPRAKVDDHEISVKADEKLHEIYEAKGRREATEEVLCIYDLIYLLLMKTVLIKFHQGIGLAQRVRELYEFMHYKLSTLMVREPIIALWYFTEKIAPRFFRKVQPSCDDLPKVISGMAWDLMLFRHLDLMTTARSHGDYLVPYFLSFDKGLIEAYDLISVKATFTSRRRAGHYPLWEIDPQNILKRAGVFDCVEEFFMPPAHNVRNYERQNNPDTKRRALKATLEHAVRKLQS
jgi:hypothetical protein